MLHRGKQQSKLAGIWSWEHGGKAGGTVLLPLVTGFGKYKVLYFFVKLGDHSEGMGRVMVSSHFFTVLSVRCAKCRRDLIQS